MGRDRARAGRSRCVPVRGGRNVSASLDFDLSECAARWEWSREFPAGVELFKQGSCAREVYLVERGLAKLICVTSEGQEIIVGLRSPGWILGANSAILGKPYPVGAVTLTRSRLRCIYAEQFIRLVRSDLEFSWYLQILQNQEMTDHLAHIVGQRCLTARQRFEQLLLRLVASIHHGRARQAVRFRLPMKHWEMAQLIGITPEHLCRLERKMEQEGLLQRENGWLVISDLDRLYDQQEF
ncbi:MAG TPA: Crp/Fnr family transcriptional regulator [Blastocatellia bacterium]|nr:Crp/Fnr family transcriptional regulator [Blastocatellia bacterium]